MSNRLKALLIATTFIFHMSAAGAQELSAGQKNEVKRIIKEYLLENPEILAEVQQAYELKQRAAEEKSRTAALTQLANDVFRLPGDAVLGNTKGAVTVVEFLDYNCGWCKRSVGEVSKLVESDKDVRIVFKEFPIFGEGSEYAARAALASQKQGKYWDLHQALFLAEQQVTPEVVDAIAKAVGINLEQLKKDMDDPAVAATIARNQELAQSLLLTGTPAFIIDEQVHPGYIPHSKIAEAISLVRTAGGCKIC